MIARHLRMRSHMQVRDVYKLLYQGVMGSEHLVISPREFEDRLSVEFAEIEPGESDPLFESIHPAGLLQRVNLRPYKARDGDLPRLVEACLETARHQWGTLDELQAAWSVFVRLCQQGQWPSLFLPDVMAFTRWLEKSGFPSVHHSESYRNAYRPAYRLIGSRY